MSYILKYIRSGNAIFFLDKIENKNTGEIRKKKTFYVKIIVKIIGTVGAEPIVPVPTPMDNER